MVHCHTRAQSLSCWRSFQVKTTAAQLSTAAAEEEAAMESEPLPAHDYSQKVVRDLAWSVGLLGPPMLTVGGGSGPDALALWDAMLAATPAWLARLDAQPKALEDFLGTLSGLGRVQNYHAGLVQFWLAHARVSSSAAAKDQQPEQPPAQRQTMWGLQVGGRRLTSDLKILTALHPDELDGLAKSTVLHVEPSLVFAIDNSASTSANVEPSRGNGALPGTGEAEGAEGVPLGSLVSFDLDANLLYRLEVSLHKMQIAGYPQIKDWICQHFQRENVSSISRISGGVFAPLKTRGCSSAGAPDKTINEEDGGSAGFWTEDVETLVASRPNSRWAIVDWRHFLAPAKVVQVSRGGSDFH